MRSVHSRTVSKVILLSMLGALAGGGVYATAHAGETPRGAIDPQPAEASGDVSALVASVQPAVVNITVADQRRLGAGSGFIIDDKGHVVTNAHVVDGASRVKVKLADERELDAKVLGTDKRLDIAVLELKGGGPFSYVTLGSSTNLKVGQVVVAIGNPFGLGGTVTSGIVSAKGRAIGAGPYDDFIQTDASINPGNSGGPLFDRRGQVVGMNTAINASGQGIGFAIPSDAIKAVLTQLIETGHVRRGKIGAHIADVDDVHAKVFGTSRGALIGSLEKGGPGEKAGLRDGDLIVSVDGVAVAHGHDLPRAIATHAPGSRVVLNIRRASTAVDVPVVLGELEAN